MQKINIQGGKIIDLSHPVEPDMPCDPSLKLPELKFFSRVGENGALHNLEVVSYCPHTGTHMDSPFHVQNEGGDMTTLDPMVLTGPACIISISTSTAAYGIKAEDILAWEAQHGAIKQGEGVMFETGHAARWTGGFDKYIGEGYVYLEHSAADLLVDRQARFVALESICVDVEGTDIHKKLMNAGIVIVENICNLKDVGQPRCSTIGTFPAIVGATASWVRILAVV